VGLVVVFWGCSGYSPLKPSWVLDSCRRQSSLSIHEAFLLNLNYANKEISVVSSLSLAQDPIQDRCIIARGFWSLSRVQVNI
jgi:hypothetical protein